MMNILAQMLIYTFLFEADAGGDVYTMISTTCFYRQRRLLFVFLLRITIVWKLLRLSGAIGIGRRPRIRKEQNGPFIFLSLCPAELLGQNTLRLDQTT